MPLKKLYLPHNNPSSLMRRRARRNDSLSSHLYQRSTNFINRNVKSTPNTSVKWMLRLSGQNNADVEWRIYIISIIIIPGDNYYRILLLSNHFLVRNHTPKLKKLPSVFFNSFDIQKNLVTNRIPTLAYNEQR